MSSVRTFKIGDRWSYDAQGHIEKGYPTKDAAQLAGEKYLVDKRKAEAEARREAREKKEYLEEEEKLDEK